MKKYFLIVALTIVTALGARADAGDVSIAGQVGFASRHAMFGIGGQLQFEPVRNFRIAPEFIYYFENDHVNAYNVNVNLHYTIRTSSVVMVYPLAGFSYSHFNNKNALWEESTDRYGANIGCGVEYHIQSNLAFFSEQRFQVLKNNNQSVTLLGVKYTF